MRAALAQAELAQQRGEVPVGAVLVQGGRIVAAAHNAPITHCDPTAHAEIEVLRAGAQALGNYRLSDCTLYVTLEPCAMCAGAIAQARLAEVVYGTPDAKAGALDSVVQLLREPRINHHTRWRAGVLQQDCAALLRDFFKTKRTTAMQQPSSPLRPDALRTPDHHFEQVPDYPWAANYVSDLNALDGLRMHYLDEGERNAPITWLCLHGNPSWSYLYRKMIPIFLAAGHRVVAPDLIGFGKSDKPKHEAAHSFSWHRQVLLELVERLDLRQVNLVVQDWGGLLGLTLPMQAPERYRALLVMNTSLATGDAALSPGFLAWRQWCAQNPQFDVSRLFARGNPSMSAAQCAAYNAPFPDNGHRAALRAFPNLVPEHRDSDGAALSRQARDFWSQQWQGKSLMAIGTRDPVLGTEGMQALRANIRGCGDPMLLPDAGHFTPERGEAIARHALAQLA